MHVIKLLVFKWEFISQATKAILTREHVIERKCTYTFVYIHSILSATSASRVRRGTCMLTMSSPTYAAVKKKLERSRAYTHKCGFRPCFRTRYYPKAQLEQSMN